MKSNRIGDLEVLPDLLNQIPESAEIIAVYGDGTYDTKQCYKSIIDVKKNTYYCTT